MNARRGAVLNPHVRLARDYLTLPSPGCNRDFGLYIFDYTGPGGDD